MDQTPDVKKIPIITQKAWNIPRETSRFFSKAHLEDTLRAVNLATGTHCYVRDSCKQKIIVDSSSALILCGHPKHLAEREGFNFYQRILHEDDWKWLVDMNVAGYEVFFNYSESQRLSLVSSYDLSVKTANNGSLILHHCSSPYRLCENGNLWLSLSCVSPSTQENSGNATITNTATGETYNFIDGKFVLSAIPSLTREEVLILELQASELSVQQISERLQISESSLWRKREVLCRKLGVISSVGAVHKAHLLGIL